MTYWEKKKFLTGFKWLQGDNMRYFKKIIGDYCYLSPINIADAEKYTEWLNDLEIAKNLIVSDQQINVMKEEEILNDMIRRGAQIFAIIDIEKDTMIGNCSLFKIDHSDRKAELGIFIGDKTYWDKGYGTEAMRLLLDYGFNILNLHNILLNVHSFNKRALRAYEKVGFKLIGRRRESFIIAGKKYDEIFMDILDDDFESPFIKEIVERI
jgi:RimJ/RimL family protein N-acetyltransferase